MQTEAAAAAPTFRLGDRSRLFLASFLMLFVELALIRWIAAYVVHVAYFTNFVLLASFLGIGLGFLRARAKGDMFRWAALGVATLAAWALLFPVAVLRYSGGEVVGLFGMPALPIWISLPILFLGTTTVMACIAQGVGRIFDRFEALEAYRLDVMGSIGGIVAFSSLSFLRLGPVVWGVVIAALFVALMPRPGELIRWLGLAAVALIFTAGSLSPLDTWSPYYRVTVHPADDEGRINVSVNNLPHQSILPLAKLKQDDPFYLYPYTHLKDNPLEDVLVVGAGNGNDVAVALSKGAGHVDAVEIDPVLLENGELRHPEHPYQDPRVTAHVDDGRAFLERTDQRYDLIMFALPDSLTLVAGQGSLRLESYLFTREAMTTVREHLKPQGVFAMYNYYRPFVFERYANTMTEVFGHPPCFDQGPFELGPRSQSVLTVANEQGTLRCSTPFQPSGISAPPATDDKPFPYVPAGTFPGFYLVALALILVASLIIVRVGSGAPLRRMRGYTDLFFMGAAFLLLETKSVVQFALLFGTTWLVNSLVFAGILLAVLGAVELARRVRLPRPGVLYALLLAALAVAWFVPPAQLLSLAPVPRFVAGVVVAFTPVFLANLIFARRFRDVGTSTVAFGANLLGAMVGGVLEYMAILTGYRNLLLAVALLYGGAFLLERRRTSRPASEEAEPQPEPARA